MLSPAERFVWENLSNWQESVYKCGMISLCCGQHNDPKPPELKGNHRRLWLWKNDIKMRARIKKKHWNTVKYQENIWNVPSADLRLFMSDKHPVVWDSPLACRGKREKKKHKGIKEPGPSCSLPMCFMCYFMVLTPQLLERWDTVSLSGWSFHSQVIKYFMCMSASIAGY